MAWAQYIINTIDPEISKSIKYAIEMRLQNKYSDAVILYRNGIGTQVSSHPSLCLKSVTKNRKL